MTHQSCKIGCVYKTPFHKSGHVYRYRYRYSIEPKKVNSLNITEFLLKVHVRGKGKIVCMLKMLM